MSSFILIDDIIDFTNELIYLIKQDWEKFKKFVKEYKKYVFWIVVLFITMQFTDLMSLGSSWERYCNKNSNIQKGGSNADVALAIAQKHYNTQTARAASIKAENNIRYAEKEKRITKREMEKNARANEKDKKKGGAGATAAPVATVTAPTTGTAPTDATAAAAAANAPAETAEQSKKRLKTEKKTAHKEDIRKKARQLLSTKSGSETKDIEKKLGWFKQFKANLGNGAGPVFGNLDRIFKYTEAMFVIITSLLIIVGVLSLPVLIFLIITYCVIKMMVGKFMIL